MKTIPLSKGKFAQVDDADYERLSKYNWFLHVADEDHQYAVTWVGTSAKDRKLVRMHRMILNLDACRKPLVDHRDRDGLNNQRSNLRACEQWQNQGNSRKPRKPSTSRYKGVFWDKRKSRWKAIICRGHKLKHLGTFHREEDAARAYDIAAIAQYGEFARTNHETKR